MNPKIIAFGVDIYAIENAFLKYYSDHNLIFNTICLLECFIFDHYIICLFTILSCSCIC